uniref:C2 domain-containing protein n=1 Tax=Macrostomum lignano TaxID=282301 RepID=A0A1I8FNR4_9PLAT
MAALPASLWDRGSPAAFVFRPAATLRRFRGPLSCCASPRVYPSSPRAQPCSALLSPDDQEAAKSALLAGFDYRRRPPPPPRPPAELPGASLSGRPLIIQAAWRLISELMRDSPPPKPVSVVATETVSDTVSPMFGVCLISGYRFEERQTIQVEVFAEVESASPEAASSPPEFEADLESPVSASRKSFPGRPPPVSVQLPSAALSPEHHHLLSPWPSLMHEFARQLIGSCSVSLGHVIHCGGRVTCQLGRPCQLALRGRGLDKKDLFGKSDPYVLLQRRDEDMDIEFGRVHRANSRPQLTNLLAGQNSELQFDV